MTTLPRPTTISKEWETHSPQDAIVHKSLQTSDSADFQLIISPGLCSHFECKLCHFAADTPQGLESHISRHHEIHCTFCRARSLSLPQIMDHVKCEHFAELSESSTNGQSGLDQDPCNACQLCDFMTYSEEHLESHTRDEHNGMIPASVLKIIPKSESARVRNLDVLYHSSFFCKSPDRLEAPNINIIRTNCEDAVTEVKPGVKKLQDHCYTVSEEVVEAHSLSGVKQECVDGVVLEINKAAEPPSDRSSLEYSTTDKGQSDLIPRDGISSPVVIPKTEPASCIEESNDARDSLGSVQSEQEDAPRQQKQEPATEEGTAVLMQLVSVKGHDAKAKDTPGVHSCHVCNLAFGTWPFLENHIQRRHNEEFHNIKIMSEGEKTSQERNYTLTGVGERPYICNECGRSFTRSEHIQTHMRIHTGEKPFVCNECGRSFSIKGSLRHHMKTHTGEKPYKCHLCEKRFSKKGNHDAHLRTHTGEKPFKCKDCGKAFYKSTNLLRHTKLHSQENRFKCQECGKRFISIHDLNTHMVTHTEENPFKCDFCSKHFSSSSNLYRHMRSHTGDNPYRCDWCGKSYSSHGKLEEHMRVHTVQKPFKCLDCGHTFRDSANLTTHMKTHKTVKTFTCEDCGRHFPNGICLYRHSKAIHRGEKPYLCSDCGKTFDDNCILRAHMKTHTKDKPFRCQDCGKTFSLLGYLRKHRRTHTGDRPYQCGECRKSFNGLVDLRRHMRIHTGEKPFQCDECGKRFTLRHNLRKHETTHRVKPDSV